jgi:hypothetical protein
MTSLPPAVFFLIVAVHTNPAPFLSRRKMIKATQKLHEMGQSLWLDNITRMIFACAAASHRNFERSLWRPA